MILCAEPKLICNRILHYSSFTAFVVIFFHAISANSSEDNELLDVMVGILEKVRSSSARSERLYQVCATFAGLARELTASRRASVGVYNLEDDLLELPELSNDAASSHFHDSFGLEISEFVEDWEAYDMDSIMAGWATGDSTPLNMWRHD